MVVIIIFLSFIACTVLLYWLKYYFAKADNPYTINGYHQEFRVWSDLYRKYRNYTCEKCGIQLSGKDKYYLHTHHIDGNKQNNHPNNFMALCIACHAQQPGPGHQRLKCTPAYKKFSDKPLKSNSAAKLHL